MNKNKIVKKIFIALFILSFGFTQAQYTLIPDPNFEQFLLDNGIDSEAILDGRVLTSDIDTITNLEIIDSDNNISDLTGLEDFILLEDFRVAFTLCTSIDFSGNANLEILICMLNSNLTSIDISQSNLLRVLSIEANNLTSLNVTQNLELTGLLCALNQLTSLDLSQNINLSLLGCESNQITNLDLSQNINLSWLGCSSNLLTNLDMRNGNNINVTVFNSSNNLGLQCIFVDNSDYSELNWTNIDDTSTFVETEVECEELAVHDFELNDFVIYPNPTNSFFRINTTSEIKNIKVYNALGKLVKEFNNSQIEYDIHELSNGIYFLIIQTDFGIIRQKIIFE